MTREEMLEKQNTILSFAIDRIWDHLTIEEQEDKEWIWKEMDDDLNALQNEQTGRVLKRLFDKWGDDNSKG